ncbi:MAG: IclR family transcriptional regulator domain-containing protein [Rhodospirillaceae bacterium]
MENKRYVQAFDRGLAVLAHLNLSNGSSIGDIAAATGINRAIIYRLLETLRRAGYVSKESKSPEYWLTSAVRNLADGYVDEEWIQDIAKPIIDQLNADLVWPVSVSTVSGTSMLVRVTSDFESPLTFNRFPRGFRFSMAQSAAGQVYLAFSPPQHLTALTEVLRRTLTDHKELSVLAPRTLDPRLQKIREQGYASITGQLNNINALAVPIKDDETVFGALSLRYFATAMKPKKAVERFFEPLRQAADTIASSLR